MKIQCALCTITCWLSLANAAATGNFRGVKARVLAHESSSSKLSAPPLLDILKKERIKEAVRVAASKPVPAPMPAPMPGPYPGPAPGPAPMPFPFPAPAPMPDPLPPCNWTLDWEGVARPAICENMTDGNHTCVRSENLTFDDNITTCIPPVVARCENPAQNGQFPEDKTVWPFMALYALDGITEATIKHGQEFDIICAENATAVDHRYPLEAWGQDWYPGIQKHAVVCNNGTIMRMTETNQSFFEGHPAYSPPGIKPGDLRCEMKLKVSLTQDDVSYLRWSEPRMIEAETRGYKWIDSEALLHKMLLKDAMNKSHHIEMDARDRGILKDIPYLERTIKALVDNRMIPRGETLSQETCKDLEKHWLYGLENSDPFKKANHIGYANWVPEVDKKNGYPLASDIKLERPVGFSCSYTLQKSPSGRDPYSGVMNYRFRDGCFCESNWVGGCPYRAELKPSFKTFGFESAEVKMVSTGVGAPTNALCWYFTKPANPEWGYLRTDTGYAYQAPAQNVTELKRDWIELKKLAQKARFKNSPTR